MFYMYEHPFCKVVTSVTTTLRLTDAMYEHPFCKVVTSVDLKITVLRDSMSILFERLLHPTLVCYCAATQCICIDFVRLLHPLCL